MHLAIRLYPTPPTYPPTQRTRPRPAPQLPRAKTPRDPPERRDDIRAAQISDSTAGEKQSQRLGNRAGKTSAAIAGDDVARERRAAPPGTATDRRHRIVAL